MNAKPNPRVQAAMSDAGQSTPPEASPAKRSKPTPSPEFAQARLRRDIRLLDERRSKLFRTFEEKKKAIDAERERLCEELAAVEAKLDGGA